MIQKMPLFFSIGDTRLAKRCFVADFFGNPSMNLISGEIISNESGPAFHSMGVNIELPENIPVRNRDP